MNSSLKRQPVKQSSATRSGQLSTTEVLPGPPTETSALMKKADRYMLIGLIFVGTWAFSAFGLPFLIYSFLLMRKAQRQGELSRPWSVTIVGAFCIVDVAVNYFGWGTDLLPSHDTSIIETLWTGYGKLFDGGYYLNYNSTPLGGLAAPTEKTLEFACIFVMYPMRIAAAWAFLHMKKWGLQGMIITSWMYLSLWFVYYLPQISSNFDHRWGGSIFGSIGFWFIGLVFVSPFVLIPYFYTVDRSMFKDGP
jgi:hypothetical protein